MLLIHTFASFITQNNSNYSSLITYLYRFKANDYLRLNVKFMSPKRSLKILQLEKKIEIKRSFYLFRDTIFNLFGGQSIAFTL